MELDQNRGQRMRLAMVIALCALFLFMAVGLTLMGSSVYRRVTAASQDNEMRRTAMSYLVNQVRRGDSAGGVSAGELGEVDAVVLRETAGEISYVTYLYCHEGSLMELYTEEGLGLGAADGVAILPMQSLTVREERGGLAMTLLFPDETQEELFVCPRSEKEGGGSP